MTQREIARTHLHLADEAVESFKDARAGTSFKERVALSVALMCVRALTAAVFDVAEIKGEDL